MEDPAFKEISMAEGRSFERIPMLTPYRAAGHKAFVGDTQLARVHSILKNEAIVLDLPAKQVDAAVYMLNKIIKSWGVKPRGTKRWGPVGDWTVGSRALLFVAGRQLGLTQQMNRFIPAGRKALFLK